MFYIVQADSDRESHDISLTPAATRCHCLPLVPNFLKKNSWSEIWATRRRFQMVRWKSPGSPATWCSEQCAVAQWLLLFFIWCNKDLTCPETNKFCVLFVTIYSNSTRYCNGHTILLKQIMRKHQMDISSRSQVKLPYFGEYVYLHL